MKSWVTALEYQGHQWIKKDKWFWFSILLLWIGGMLMGYGLK